MVRAFVFISASSDSLSIYGRRYARSTEEAQIALADVDIEKLDGK